LEDLRQRDERLEMGWGNENQEPRNKL